MNKLTHMATTQLHNKHGQRCHLPTPVSLPGHLTKHVTMLMDMWPYFPHFLYHLSILSPSCP